MNPRPTGRGLVVLQCGDLDNPASSTPRASPTTRALSEPVIIAHISLEREMQP